MKIMLSFCKKIIITPFLIFLFINSQAMAQDFWQRTNGPEGGLIRAFAINSNGNIFVGTVGGGIFRSTDNGSNWTEINAGLTNTNVQALAINSNGNIFAGAVGGGVFRSTDNGSNWIEINAGLTNTDVRALAINANDDIFAGTFGGGIFRSTDNGGTWTEINNGLTDPNAFHLAISSGGSVFAGTNDGLFASEDNGDNWSKISGLTFANIGAIFINSSNEDIFVGNFDDSGGVNRSADNGNSWTDISAGLPNNSVRAITVNSNGDIFVGTNGDGIFRSTDNGGSWTQLNGGGAFLRKLIISSNDEIFAGTNGGAGIHRSSDNGDSWTKINTGLKASFIRSLAVNSNDDVFAANFGIGVNRSTDDGENWLVVSDGLTNTNVRALVINSNGHIFAGTGGDGVFRSIDDGGSWTQVNTGLANTGVFALAIHNDEIFAGTNDGVFRSSDNGDTWTAGFSGLTRTDFRSLAINSSGEIFAGTNGGGLFRSSDNGSSWTDITNDLGDNNIPALAINSNDHIFAGTFNNAGVFRSTNNGDNWSAVNNNLPIIRAFALLTNSLDHIFLGNDEGVFRSTDNGDSWEKKSTGLDIPFVRSFAINSKGRLFAGTFGGGVFRGRTDAQQDSLSLVALYNSTDGANWTDNSNWLSSQPISTWFGVTTDGNGRVTSLDLRTNNLAGTIPSEIGDLTSLTTLLLIGNQLSGPIPPEIGNLSNLVTLRFNNNQLSGGIPAEIVNLTNLTTLDFTANQLTGSIPSEIGNLGNLVFLSFRRNQIVGEVPASIGALTNLQVIDVAFNNISGSIPEELGQLTKLTGVVLDFNNFTGTIPTSMGNLTEAVDIHLGANQLVGAVPAELTNLNKLAIFNIFDNFLTDLPDFSSISTLGEFRINNNRFTFEDIEPNIGIQGFDYAPQDSVGVEQDTSATLGSSLTISVTVGGDNNQYQWHFDGNPISDATGSSYTIDEMGFSDVGAYICLISNTVARDLTLESRPINVTVDEQTSPQITSQPVLITASGQSTPISATITDDVGIQSARFFYRGGGASSYSSTIMTNTSGDSWQGTIPASFITERGVEYYISALDVGGNTTTFPAINPQDNPLVIQVTSSNLTFSSPNLAYRMISLPIDLDNSSPSSVLEDDLGSYDDTQWRLLRYLSGNNVEFPNAGNLQAGLGFWLITRGAKSLDTGSGISVSTGQNFIVTLQPGWNQIGNPFAFPVNWQDVIRNGAVEDVLVGYQGSTNDATGYDFTRSQLQPFQGYFVNNQEAITVTIEIPPQSATGTTVLAKQAGRPVLSTLQNNEWALQLAAQSDRFLDKDNYIGVLNEASDTWDRNDFSEAPFFDSFVSLYFPHEDWEVYPGLYTGDFRSINTEGHFWDFHVKSNIANSEVVLTLAYKQNLPSETEVVLIDKASRISISLLEQDSYTFPSGEDGAERDFRIVVGKSDFVDSNDLDFSGIPEAFTLSQNYPNPFNPETNIDYELPLEGEVKIAVYNLRGQRVRTLLDAQQNPGRYTVSWDGKSDNGLSVATGVYLVRMQAGKFVSVRKILLTK